MKYRRNFSQKDFEIEIKKKFDILDRDFHVNRDEEEVWITYEINC